MVHKLLLIRNEKHNLNIKHPSSLIFIYTYLLFHNNHMDVKLEWIAFCWI